MTPLDYALQYLQRGWKPVRIPAGQKGPRIREWQKQRLTEAEATKHFNCAGNIGIILGEASGGLVDIDLDCPAAIQFAQSLLPTTQSIFGRISKPHSHRLYRVSGPAPSLQFKDPINGDTLLELRGDGGRQTVFPPSINPSGESVDWSADGEPQQVDYVVLTKRVKQLAARCLIARYLPAVANGTELWKALPDVDKRVAERILDWMEISTAPAVSPNAPVTIGGQLSQQIPDYLGGLPGTNRVHQVLHSFARSDLNDAVRELAAQKKPGRADLLYRKSIRMGGLIEQGLIDLAAVRTALYEASVHNGLVAENGKQDVLRNIERGFVYCATKAQEASSAAIGFATIIFCGDGGQRADADALETRSDQRPSDDALLNELANLSYIEYARRRPEAAQTLGIPLSFLDKEVEKRRSKLDGRDWEQPLFDHWAVEPWPELVDGDALILSLVRRLRSHVVMSCEAALTVALWITLTWVHADAAVHSPILMITSPEAACGKTTLLGIIGFLAKQALSSVSISPAVLYRAIERWSPCLIIDEADTAFDENEELRAVVNSGWTRGQGVLRCDGEEHEPRLFATFCPKAIGVKGKKLPDTTSSRSIIIELKRKIADETVKDFRHVDDPELVELRQKLLRWSMDNRAELLKANPQLPNGFINRVAANWLLPLAIADVAGGEWPDKAREAAALISQEERNSSIGTQLLADIQAAFGDNDDRLFSSTLVDKLTADPEAPWATYNRGKELTQKQLANRLKDYRIVSETVWIAGKSAKGYKRSAFEDAWLRYLSD